MKKILLSALVLVSNVAILGQSFQYDAVNTTAFKAIRTFNSIQELMFAIRDEIILSDELAYDEIENMLFVWYENNRNLFYPTNFMIEGTPQYDFDLSNERGRLLSQHYKLLTHITPHILANINDIIQIAIATFYKDMSGDALARSAFVLHALNALGVNQKLSTQQVYILSKYLEIETTANLVVIDTVQDQISLLEQLAQVSNIDLPEIL